MMVVEKVAALAGFSGGLVGRRCRRRRVERAVAARRWRLFLPTEAVAAVFEAEKPAVAVAMVVTEAALTAHAQALRKGKIF